MNRTKNIGILTYSHTHNMNFGAMLQSFATYTIINRLGYEAFLIDWDIQKKSKFTFDDIKNEGSQIKYLKFVIKRLVGVLLSKPVKRIARIIGEKPFIQFSNTYMCQKTEKVSLKSFSNLNKSLDGFIVGSDQVWRYTSCPDINTFFFNFVNPDKLKIAYAASFGVDKWNEAPKEVTVKVSSLINKFDYISVREDSGVRICKDIFEVSANHVLDPTLLLDKIDYEKIIKESNIVHNIPDKYIAMMLLDNTCNLGLANKLVEKTGIKTVDIKGRKLKVLGRYFTKFCSVPEWMSQIKNAEFIVTDSFHCAVFCVIFEKSFAVLVNKKRGKSRLDSLLSLLKLNDILFDSSNDLISSNIWKMKIDYNSVNFIYKEEKERSLKFLINSLKNE